MSLAKMTGLFILGMIVMFSATLYYGGRESVKPEVIIVTDTIKQIDTLSVIDTVFISKFHIIKDTVYIERDTTKVDYHFKYDQADIHQTWMITGYKDSLLNMNAIFYPEVKYIKEKEYVTKTVTNTNTITKYRKGVYTGVSYNTNFSNPMYGIHGGYSFSSGFILNGNLFVINQKDLYLGFGINKIW